MLENELDFAIGLAREAGQEILRLAQSEAQLEYKEDGELVTSIDKAVDTAIREAIQRKYPSDGILTEESLDDRSRLERARVWIIDPVDGTEELKDYLKQPTDYPYFAVHIGLAIRGRAYLGVVDVPVLRETYSGVRGQCSFVDTGEKRYTLQVSNVRTTEDARVGICSPKRTKNIAAAQAIGFHDFHYVQSLGVKACFIAAGQLDAYITVSNGGTKEWDTCAPSVIVEEAGGRVSDCYGNSISYNKRDVHNHSGVLITNGFIHNQVVQRMPRI